MAGGKLVLKTFGSAKNWFWFHYLSFLVVAFKNQYGKE